MKSLFFTLVLPLLFIACKDKAPADSPSPGEAPSAAATKLTDASPSTAAPTPAPETAGGKGEGTDTDEGHRADGEQPPADHIWRRMSESKLSLDVTPPATLGAHIAANVTGSATPKIDCEPSGAGGWDCSVWAGDGFFYSVSVSQAGKDWHISDAEVLAND
jgi:hypothetical protein